jgi:RNA polymerase sigma-70 factor (ECF subfamily)
LPVWDFSGCLKELFGYEQQIEIKKWPYEQDVQVMTINNKDYIIANKTDLKLLQAIKENKQEALSHLYDRYASHIMAVALKILKNRQEAEDLVHDVFLEVWQKARQYEQRKGSVKNWLLLRTRSRSIDRIRKLNRIETHSNIEESEHFKSEQKNEQANIDPVQQLNHQQANQAINALPPEHALLIRASYFEDLSYREIAKKYEIPEGTVKSRMLVAYKILRNHFIQPMGAANG